MSGSKSNKKIAERIVSILIIILLIILAIVLIKNYLDIKRMQNELYEVREQIKEQQIINNDLELMLANQEEYFERKAREILGYADPEEEVYVYTTGN